GQPARGRAPQGGRHEGPQGRRPAAGGLAGGARRPLGGAGPPGARSRAAPGGRRRPRGLRRDPPRPHRERPAATEGGPAMTDEAYRACTAASRLLHFLSPRLNERKLRLFVAACLRRAAGDRHAAAVRTLVEALEALADGHEGPAALEAARGDLWRART